MHPCSRVVRSVRSKVVGLIGCRDQLRRHDFLVIQCFPVLSSLKTIWLKSVSFSTSALLLSFAYFAEFLMNLTGNVNRCQNCIHRAFQWILIATGTIKIFGIGMNGTRFRLTENSFSVAFVIICNGMIIRQIAVYFHVSCMRC